MQPTNKVDLHSIASTGTKSNVLSVLVMREEKCRGGSENKDSERAMSSSDTGQTVDCKSTSE